jgi:trigger factor
VRLNGFRPGKVPVSHLKKVYGRSVMAETIDQTIRDTNSQIFTERGFRLATEPKITMPTEEKDVEEILAGKSDLTYTVSVEVVPAIQLADFKTFTVEKPVADVTDADVDEAIKRIADQSRAYVAKAEGAKAESGDRVTINFKGTIDGTPFEGGTGEGIQVAIGSNSFIPGFEEQIVGMKAGESRTVTATFPENYLPRHLAGKEATFDVTAKSVAAPGELAIDDAFAKGFNFDSLEAMKTAIRGNLEAEWGRASREKLKRTLLDALDKKYSFELPAGLVDQEFAGIWKQVEAEQAQTGKSFADEETTEEAARADYRRIAERRVRLGLLLAEVGDKAEVKVDDNEVTQALVQRARAFPGQEQQVWDHYRKNPQALAELRAPIFEDKVVDHIIAQAKVSDRKVDKDELFRMEEETETEAA